MIPDYINPDGMKNIPGDIVYLERNIYIEVKYDKLQFTKTQYKNWIFNEQNERPNYIICIHNKGVLIQEWEIFRKKYMHILEKLMNISLISLLNKKYTPVILLEKYIGIYKNEIRKKEYFNVVDNNEEELTKRINEIF